MNVGGLSLRDAHALVGLFFVAVFLATGVYMLVYFPEAYLEDGGMRMMFRSAHVYILFAALLNLLASGEPPAHARRRRVRLHRLGSLLLLAAPALLTAAFFLEPAPQRFDRPLALTAVAFAAVGTILQFGTHGDWRHRQGRGNLVSGKDAA